MKRHPILQPFSRDHNVGLVIARRLVADPLEALADFLVIWDDEMADHFKEEEDLLGPLASDSLRSRLFADHAEVRDFVVRARRSEVGEDEIRKVGVKLQDHIRWEEHDLFPAVESSESLATIGAATEAMEERRHNSPHSPRRGELMDRRV